MEITPQLAEIAGIHAGDGYLRHQGKIKEFDVSGGYEEQDYYDNAVIPLVNEAFGLSITGRFFPHRRTYGFVIRKEEPIKVLAQLGFPSGKKTTVVAVPNVILQCSNIDIISSFLRGYFDTDGCVTFTNKPLNASYFQRKYHYYPRLMFNTCSEELKNGFLILVEKLGFHCTWSTHQPRKQTESLKYKLQIVGKDALIKWMQMVGSNNPSKISRFLIWKGFGFCPPHTTYSERVEILEGRRHPGSFYKGPVV